MPIFNSKQLILLLACTIVHNSQGLILDQENSELYDTDSLLELHCPQPCVDVLIFSTTPAHVVNYLMALDIFTIDTKNVYVLYPSQQEAAYAPLCLEYPTINFIAYDHTAYSFTTACNKALNNATQYVMITYDTQYLRKPLSLTYCIQNLKKTKASSWYLSMNLKAFGLAQAIHSQACQQLHDDVYAFSCFCINPASHTLLAGIHAKEALMSAIDHEELVSLEQLTAQLYTIQVNTNAVGLFFEQSIINESWLLA